jgi:hypothetical protein
VIRSQANISLLLSIRSDKGVDLGNLNLVDGGNGVLDLSLVGGDVDDENKGVVLLDLLHGRFSGQGELDHVVSLRSNHSLGGLGDHIRLAGKLKSVGAVEVHFVVHAGSFATASLLECGGSLCSLSY